MCHIYSSCFRNYQKHLISIIHCLKRVYFHILQDIILYELKELWGKEGHKTFTALYLFYFYKNLENLYLKLKQNLIASNKIYNVEMMINEFLNSTYMMK